jgi:hypothetical protein
MNPSQDLSLVKCRLVCGKLGAAFIALSLLGRVIAASVLSPVAPAVTLTNSIMKCRLPESPDLGWIIQQSSDLAHWESLGDPVNVAPRTGPVLDLPFLQAQPQSFFRAVPADRLARKRLLQEQWSRWKTAGLHTYEFEFRWSCFCVPEFTQWVRIAVADGTLVSVRRVADGGELPADLWTRYQTMDGLFAWLADAFEQSAERIEVSYDAGLGHPLSGYIDYHAQMADEERGFQVRFPPLPAAMILTDAPALWPGDPYVIESMRREGDWLQFDIAYSGGCVDPHGWELTAVPAPPAPGRPRELACYLIHNARGDTCEAYLHKRLTFGLSSLRAWRATWDPALGGESAHLILVVQDPRSSRPDAYAAIDYKWEQASFVPWRDVLTATSRQWHGGVFGSGLGTDYHLTLQFPPSWGEAIQVRTLWIDDRAFIPEVQWSALPWGGGRLATLSAVFREVPRLDPNNPGQILGIDELPPRDPHPPGYAGAALLITEALGQTQEWPIPVFHELPPVFYP